MKIGFFDSGIGGISVLACARRQIPSADYLYYADTDHVPYGVKKREEIISYSDQAVSFLRNCGADVLVIACNTATSMAAQLLREKYNFPILGMEPAVKPAVEKYPDRKILICATPVTIAGKKLQNLIEDHFPKQMQQPTLLALPELVTYAENAVFEPEIICPYLLSKIEHPEQYSAVVLGCTHFPYFRDSFQKVFGTGTELIDGAAGTVRHLQTVLEERGYKNTDQAGCVEYFCSGRKVEDEKLLRFYRLLDERSQERAFC